MTLPAAHVETPGAQIQYRRDNDMVFRRLGEEMVLVPIRRGIGDFDCFYILNETGRLLWEKLASPCTEDELVTLLLAAFDVAPDDARRDVQQFLADLRRLKAVS